MKASLPTRNTGSADTHPLRLLVDALLWEREVRDLWWTYFTTNFSSKISLNGGKELYRILKLAEADVQLAMTNSESCFQECECQLSESPLAPSPRSPA